MFQLQAMHIVTIEGVTPESGLNPVQDALAKHGGSQCGFCTPGIIMALATQHEQDHNFRFNRAGAECALSGNLCRCTGYVPIVEACESILNVDSLTISERYSAPELAEHLAFVRRETVCVPPDINNGVEILSAGDIRAALEFRRHYGKMAVVFAGATDLGVQMNHDKLHPTTILDIARIPNLDRCIIESDDRGDVLKLGALTTWSSVLETVRERVPQFAEILSRFGGDQIRRLGTVGGNIANASPSADSLPFFFVCGAKVKVRSLDRGERWIPITQLYRGYKDLAVEPDELILGAAMRLPSKDELLWLKKVSRRRDLDISTVTGAVRIQMDGELIRRAAIALGAVGPVVFRARKTERFLRGKPLDEATMRAAADVLVGEIAPIGDVRGKRQYREQLVRSMLLEFLASQPAAVA